MLVQIMTLRHQATHSNMAEQKPVMQQPGQQPPPAQQPPGQPYAGPPPGQPNAGPPPAYGQPQSYGQPMQPQYGQAGVVIPMNIPGQPQVVQWMSRPEAIPGCPPGLEYLTQIDQLLIKQQIEILELFTGWEMANKYKVLNNQGQQVFFAAEESETCERQCCGPNRGFNLHITDNSGQEIIKCTREFKCCVGCCWCANADGCAHEIAVEAPPGTIVGYVRQEQSCWTPHYSIRDANHEPVLNVKGPCCVMNGCCWDQEFIVWSKDWSAEVGKLSKQWSGFAKEYFTDADNFGITFPMDLDVKMKAVMLGAIFLIDFIFFEQKQNNR
ncbi:phospholipid scramblase 2-like isoform X3 [Mizuhopecten yessoensis]|uniref:phospholipid scramblase 2-like isoform X3 n=1 Tax=Mizuhopecten yessoensis TaxID=6573 RepID=UPI000B45AA6C|nr:phospholipid scramblase 2-like isoform X3 [Mizuhopecten yessoensis]